MPFHVDKNALVFAFQEYFQQFEDKNESILVADERLKRWKESWLDEYSPSTHLIHFI